MSEFPLGPTLSKMVIMASQKFYCMNEILSIVSLMSVPSIFMRPREAQMEADHAKKKFIHQDGDHLSMLNAYNAFCLKNYNADFCWENFLNYRALNQANNIRN